MPNKYEQLQSLLGLKVTMNYVLNQGGLTRCRMAPHAIVVSHVTNQQEAIDWLALLTNENSGHFCCNIRAPASHITQNNT